MERWAGKVCLVTGASAGIGRGVALRLAGHGLKVVACARNFEKLLELQEEAKKVGRGEILPIRCDMQKEEEILEMFEKIKTTYSRLDICINNAAVAHSTNSGASLLSGTTDSWREMINVNVLALSVCTRESVKLMSERELEEGQIIHISSMSGHRLLGDYMYSATKQSVRALTEGLRQELRQTKSNIRVSCISPAAVDTEMYRRNYTTSFKKLDASDIEDSVLYILSTPPHAQVHDILIRGLEQVT